MKKNMTKIGKLFKIGLCFSLTIGLVSCAEESTGVVEDAGAVGDEVSLNAEETETFGGTAEETAAFQDDELYADLGETGLYEEWDENNDNLLDENEYYGAFYDTWDINDDNTLDENEWNTALADYGFENDAAWAWTAWNTDNDAYVDENEFGAGLGNTEYFAVWDANDDNLLDEREYTTGVYALWVGADDDGVLDDNEYNDMFVRYFDVDAVVYLPERG